MRIAQIAPLFTSVPPKGYGGPQRCIAYLVDELVRLGHEVTLFATADSNTPARLVPVCPYPLWDGDVQERMIFHLFMLEQVFKREADFDIIHNHIDYFIAPFARRHCTPVLTTVHTPLVDMIESLYQEYSELALVAISEFQRREAFPQLHWLDVVHHGLPAGLYPFQPQAGKYLAFLGSFASTKGVPAAVEIASRAGMKIKLAGRPEMDEEVYFEKAIKPLFAYPFVEYVGELDDEQKKDFLGGALALLFPISADEAFGLVMIEALACGTPVIAARRASVPEIVEEGVTGFTFQTIEEAVACVGKVPLLSRRRCREAFEAHFTMERVAQDYLALYEQLVRSSVHRSTGQ